MMFRLPTEYQAIVQEKELTIIACEFTDQKRHQWPLIMFIRQITSNSNHGFSLHLLQ